VGDCHSLGYKAALPPHRTESALPLQYLPLHPQPLPQVAWLETPVIMSEKEQYDVRATPDYNGHATASYVDPATGIESKSGRILEASDLYGNIETAEEYGYVTRG
jgi:hypothetical protein